VRGLTASVKETGQQILRGVDLTIRKGEVRTPPSVYCSWAAHLATGLWCIALLRLQRID
jgi:hypothetical protein